MKLGNLAIASHNYEDDRFFSRLNELNVGNIINLYDNSGNGVCYMIYKIFETNANDITNTLESTSNSREITLVTCNNINGNRIIVKAREHNKKANV